MDQLRSFADERLVFGCIHCGRAMESRDHIPSRILLDEPYPENLPVVPACDACNQGFSLDEEYFACLIECVRTGGVESVERPKIRRILENSPHLAARIAQAQITADDGAVSFRIESARITNVILKLARGHAAYELSEPQQETPTHIFFGPLMSLDDKSLDHFETPSASAIWPELGSRAMQRCLISGTSVHGPGWIIVQPGLYRYSVIAEQAIMVRMVLSEYLASEVIWGENDL